MTNARMPMYGLGVSAKYSSTARKTITMKLTAAIADTDDGDRVGKGRGKSVFA